MKTQKTVELISFELKDYRIIRAVKLDFEKWKDNNIIEIVGDMGNGKSSILEGLEMATTGVEHIKDKDLLELGFKSEVQMVDGEHKIFLGVKVSEISRGDNKGLPKFETYIYEKDDAGKLVTNPVIDGKKATAKEYTSLLSTALTFRMPDLFTENQTSHRKLIEELFYEDLQGLGIDEIVENIKQLKIQRDNARHERDRAAATMTAFNEMGLDEEKLESKNVIDISEFEDELRNLEIGKAILLESPEKEKEKELSGLRLKGKNVVDKMRDLNDKKNNEYQKSLINYNYLKDNYDFDTQILNDITSAVDNVSFNVKSLYNDVINAHKTEIAKKHKEYLSMDIKAPEIITILNGKVDKPKVIPEDYILLMQEYDIIAKDYVNILKSEIKNIDTSDIDNKINNVTSRIEVVKKNKELVAKYNLWKDWIKSDALYLNEIGKLRELYTKINVGVNGLVIVSDMTNSGKIEIWFEYNGKHDVELFKNKKKEFRRLYEYSHSQNAIIGILLQSAILDRKDKALRLVVLDEATQTTKGKLLLEKICLEKNLKLIITKTSDEYDINKLSDGTIVVENGEVLF